MPTRTIADRYELESKIGSGGMGTVWRAHDRLLDRIVAVKVLHEGLAEDAGFSERFRREARSAASLAHPNVVTVYDTGEADGIPFIVMEYIEGESLHQMLRRRGPLPVEDTARIGHWVLAALGHAHGRGLVHRDVKPANVLFDANSGEAKVVDFGIAKGVDETGGLTRTSGLIGTAAYLSPEQVGGEEAGPASDLYAVGCMLYACLAGEPPFGGTSPVAIAMRHLRDPVPALRPRRPDVPPELEAIVMRSLEKDPTHRFHSAAEMDRALLSTGLASLPSSEPTVAQITVPAATVAMRERSAPVPAGTQVIDRRAAAARGGGGRWLGALAAFLIVGAVAAALVLFLQNQGDPEQVFEPTATPLPTPTIAEITPAPTPAPTPTAAPTPSPTPPPTPAPPRTPRPPRFDLPGFGGEPPRRQEPTPTPTLAPQPTPTP